MHVSMCLVCRSISALHGTQLPCADAACMPVRWSGFVSNQRLLLSDGLLISEPGGDNALSARTARWAHTTLHPGADLRANYPSVR